MKTLLQLFLVGIFLLVSFFTFGQTCDTLILHSGEIKLVQRIQELGKTISYEKCEQDNDNTYILNRDKIVQIKYGQRFLLDLLAKDSILLYDIWVYSKSKYSATKGALYSLNDTFILIKPTFTLPGKISDPHKINVANIDLIQIRDKRNVRSGMTTGFLIGTATGVISGLVITSHLNSISKSAGYRNSSNLNFIPTIGLGLAGGLSGVLIGGIIGSIKINLPINRKQAQYLKQKKRLELLLF